VRRAGNITPHSHIKVNWNTSHRHYQYHRNMITQTTKHVFQTKEFAW